MRLAIMTGCAALLLAACGGQSGEGTDEGSTNVASSSLTADCAVLTSDPEAQENFDEIGITADQFCDCFIEVVEGKTELQQTQITTALERVTDGMEEGETGAEEVVSGLMREIMTATEESEDAQNLSAGISLIGQAIDDIGNSYEAGNGCPASS